MIYLLYAAGSAVTTLQHQQWQDSLVHPSQAQNQYEQQQATSQADYPFRAESQEGLK